MTISATDRTIRKNQIPFQAKWFSNGAINGAIINTVGDGDTYLFTQGNSAQIRIARPTKGDLTEARFYLNAVAPDTGIIQFGFYIGEFEADGVTAKVLSNDEKLRRYKLLTGATDWRTFGNQANIFIDSFNLLPFIPKKGDAAYNEDAFILEFEIGIKNPPIYSPFTVYEFKVDAAVTIAEVQL